MTPTVQRFAAFSGAAVAGLFAGYWLARSYDRAHREDLFSPNAWQRFAALGWLESAAQPETLPLLQDYLAWERQPTLRSRARRVITTLEAALP